MNLSNMKKTTFMCPKCMQVSASLTEDDNKNNLARINEQAEIRAKDVVFNFNFRLTCSTCGPVYLDKIIKNVKVRKN